MVRPSQIHLLRVREVLLGLDVLGEGPALLLIHGFPLDRTMWRDLLPSVPGWQRIAPDLRGMGESEALEGPWSLAEYADDLAALLDALKVESAVLCGLSMGGYVAFEMLRRHRERVRGLVLMNTRADADTPEGVRRRDELIAMLQDSGANALADHLVPKLLAPGSVTVLPHLVDDLRAVVARSPVAGLVGALEAMKARPDSTPLLSDVDLPTLVVAGSEDQLIPVDVAQGMAEAIPGSQFTVIPEAGHLTPLEQPVATSRIVNAFLEGVA